MGQNGFADDFFARIVGWGAIAVATEPAEIVARHHDAINALDLVEDPVNQAGANRGFNLDQNENVVVGVGLVILAPEGGAWP